MNRHAHLDDLGKASRSVVVQDLATLLIALDTRLLFTSMACEIVRFLLECSSALSRKDCSMSSWRPILRRWVANICDQYEIQHHILQAHSVDAIRWLLDSMEVEPYYVETLCMLWLSTKVDSQCHPFLLAEMLEAQTTFSCRILNLIDVVARFALQPAMNMGIHQIGIFSHTHVEVSSENIIRKCKLNSAVGWSQSRRRLLIVGSSRNFDKKYTRAAGIGTRTKGEAKSWATAILSEVVTGATQSCLAFKTLILG